MSAPALAYAAALAALMPPAAAILVCAAPALASLVCTAEIRSGVNFSSCTTSAPAETALSASSGFATSTTTARSGAAVRRLR